MQRPFVYINMAMTADGKITSAFRQYPSFTTPYDKRNMDRLRAEADAILVGAGTLRADDPSFLVRDPEMQAYRRSLGKPEGLLKVLVSASLDIGADSRFFTEPDGGGRIVATVDDAPPERIAALVERAEIWKFGRDQVEIPELLRRLRFRGVERLLLEGGGELNWCFVREDMVDELYVTIAPVLLGGRDAPTLLEGSGLPMKRQVRLRLLDLHREGDELYCRYGVER